MLETIQAVYEVIGPYVSTSLEQFEIAFMRDMHPEREVAIWCAITAAWLAYHEKHLGDELLPDEDEKNLLSALLSISTRNSRRLLHRVHKAPLRFACKAPKYHRR